MQTDSEVDNLTSLAIGLIIESVLVDSDLEWDGLPLLEKLCRPLTNYQETTT